MNLTGNIENQSWYTKLSKDINNEINGLAALTEQEKINKNNDIKSMIQYYHRITEFIEDRRNRIYTFTLQLLTICVAGAGLIISQQVKIPQMWFWVCMSFLVIQIIFCLVIVFVHERQSRFRYPFLNLDEFGNKWKWFYYGNKEIIKIDSNVFAKQKPENVFIPYLTGLKEFVRNYKEENLNMEIKHNIQQLFLYQVWNYYKNRFYLQLTNLRMWSLYISALVVLFIIIKFIFLK